VKGYAAAASYYHQGEYEAARWHYKDASALAAKFGEKSGLQAGIIGEGKCLVRLKKYKAAMALYVSARDLSSNSGDPVGANHVPQSLSVEQCIADLTAAIREKMDLKKRAEEVKKNQELREQMIMEKKAAEERRRLAEQEEEEATKMRTKSVAASIEARKLKNRKVEALTSEARMYKKTYRDFDVMEKAELRQHFRAYAADMDREEITKIMVRNIAPRVAKEAVDAALGKVVFEKAKEVAVLRAERRQMKEAIRKRRAKEDKVKRITMYQTERKNFQQQVMMSANTVEEACRAGVPANRLHALVEMEMKAGAEKGPQAVELFDQACRMGDAMIVESAHP
jgi:hypothetical protein